MNTQLKNSLSERALNIKDSITMATSALAAAMRKEGKDVLGGFSAGEPDFDTPERIKKAAIKAINDGKTGYTAASGIIELKEAICEKFKKDNNLDYSPNQIVVSCGAKQSIYNVFMAMLDEGDEVIIPAPFWVSYPDQVEIAGGKPVIVETEETNGFKLTPETLEAAITSKTKLLILNSPSNPTGSVYSQAELAALIPVINRHGLYVLSDEIYEKLIYDDVQHISIAQLDEEVKQRSIVINGVSKAYAMTGWRIGYLAAPLDIAKAVGKIQSQSTSNPNQPAMWASLEALQACEDDIIPMRKAFSERRQLMVDGLNAIEGISCLMPQGAFYAFPNISKLLGKQYKGTALNSSVDFCNAFLSNGLVATVPGAGFGAEGFIRMSYATSVEEIQEGLKRLSAFVAELS